MNCENVRERLTAYLDGELDVLAHAELDGHLRDCAACALALRRQQALSRAIKTRTTYNVAPPALLDSMRAQFTAPAAEAPIVSPRRVIPRAGLLAAFSALAAMVVLSVVLVAPRMPAPPAVVDEVVADHVRSLLAMHLLDVASTDQHTVKPWFAGRLDFSPPVASFAAQGFPLVGGRLDILEGRAVAALIYQRRKHHINVFIWPVSDRAPQGEQQLTRQGFHLIHFVASAMNYWIISDLDQTELQQFAALLHGGAY